MSAPTLRIALLQTHPTVGNLSKNSDEILSGLRRAQRAGAAIAVTPELGVTGYPPEDLLLRPAFLQKSAQTLRRIAQNTASTVLVCGYPSIDKTGAVRNSAAVLQSGKHLGNYDKIALPNYGVFDELRYFVPGLRPVVLESRAGARPVRIVLSICEDLWPSGSGFWTALADSKPDVVLNLSASPYERGKQGIRHRVFAEAARRTGAHVVYVNQVGGQDELVFDGRSFVISPQGRVMAEAAAFAADLLCVDVPLRRDLSAATIGALRINCKLSGNVKTASKAPAASVKSKTSNDRGHLRPGSAEEVIAALELSIKDYVEKNGFGSVGVAMSGGIDSAVVAALAVRALGKDRVIGVTLPSRITSSETLSDAKKQASIMGIRFLEIPIGDLQTQFLKTLAPHFGDRIAGSADENLQARVRGVLMMALSNHLGFLLLATGNKSELATGYCTLYGDMAGGFAPLKDLLKGWVYEIAAAINRLEGRATIPTSVIRRAPTAELRPGQKDQDTLPPYPVLDDILKQLVEKDLSKDHVAAKRGYSKTQVHDTARRLYQNEYKRRQAPPGPKVTARAFGRDRRMPISQNHADLY